MRFIRLKFELKGTSKKMKRKKHVKRIISLVGSLLAIYGVLFIVNIICNIRLRYYINTFDAVQYEKEQLVPQKEEGYYTFRTNEPFDMMYLTNIHMGGGFGTYKQDKKTIYEVITMLQAEKPDLVILGG